MTLIVQIEKMFNGEGTKVSGMDIFQMVFDACNARPKSLATNLHTEVQMLLERLCKDIQHKICGDMVGDRDVLSLYIDEWNRYELASHYTDMIWFDRFSLVFNRSEFLNRSLAKFNSNATSMKVYHKTKTPVYLPIKQVFIIMKVLF